MIEEILSQHMAVLPKKHIPTGPHHRAASFGVAVVLVDDRSPPVEHAALEVDGAGRRGVHDVAERRDVVAVADGVGQAHEPFFSAEFQKPRITRRD